METVPAPVPVIHSPPPAEPDQKRSRSGSLLEIPIPGKALPARKGVNLAHVSPEVPVQVQIAGAATVERDLSLLSQMRRVMGGNEQRPAMEATVVGSDVTYAHPPAVFGYSQGGEDFDQFNKTCMKHAEEDESPTYIAEIKMPKEEIKERKMEIPITYLPPPRRRQIKPDAGSPIPLSSLLWGGAESDTNRIATQSVNYPTSEPIFANAVRHNRNGPTQDRYEVPIGDWERVGMSAGTEDIPEEQLIWRSSLRPWLNENWRIRVKANFNTMMDRVEQHGRREVDINVIRSTRERSFQINNLLKKHRNVLGFERNAEMVLDTEELRGKTIRKVHSSEPQKTNPDSVSALEAFRSIEPVGQEASQEVKEATIAPEYMQSLERQTQQSIDKESTTESILPTFRSLPVTPNVKFTFLSNASLSESDVGSPNRPIQQRSPIQFSKSAGAFQLPSPREAQGVRNTLERLQPQRPRTTLAVTQDESQKATSDREPSDKISTNHPSGQTAPQTDSPTYLPPEPSDVQEARREIPIVADQVKHTTEAPRSMVSSGSFIVTRVPIVPIPKCAESGVPNMDDPLTRHYKQSALNWMTPSTAKFTPTRIQKFSHSVVFTSTVKRRRARTSKIISGPFQRRLQSSR